jgi:hypothetical protein
VFSFSVDLCVLNNLDINRCPIDICCKYFLEICLFSLNFINLYYSLGLDCPLKDYVLKTWSPSWCYWELVETFRSEALWKGFRLLEMYP